MFVWLALSIAVLMLCKDTACLFMNHEVLVGICERAPMKISHISPVMFAATIRISMHLESAKARARLLRLFDNLMVVCFLNCYWGLSYMPGNYLFAAFAPWNVSTWCYEHYNSKSLPLNWLGFMWIVNWCRCFIN